jgi:large repetitive protein
LNTLTLLATIAATGCTAASTPPATAPLPVKVVGPDTTAAPNAVPVRVGTCGTNQDFVLGPPVDYAPRGTTGALEIGYLNKDAPIDILVGGVDESGGARFGVMLGNGDGTFKPPVEYSLPAGAEVRSVAFTDFDTDEDLDVVTAGGTRTPQVFLNNGDGTFGEPVSLPAGPGSPIRGRVVLRVEDIHGDAHPDVVSYAGAGFDVWHDSGHATFVASAISPVDRLEHGAGLTIADFNRDGATDIAVAGTDRGAAVVVVLLGKRGGVFAGPVRYPGGASGASGTAAAVVSADFDGNGKLDLAALFTNTSGSSIAVLSGKGDGTFGPMTILPVADAAEGSTLISMDLNADGKADLVATTTRGLAVYLSNGKGFAPVALLPASDVRAVAAGDLRGDHMLGLVATRGTGQATVWPGACQ